MSATVPSDANEGCVGVNSDLAGKAQGCAGCPNQNACASGKKQVDPALSDIKERMSIIRHKILVLSGKGGVGKSTISCQLAFTLAEMGHSVGLLDIDITGPSVPQMLGLKGQEVYQSASGWSPVYVNPNLGVMSIGFMLPNANDAVIWRGPKKSGIIKQFLTDVLWGELDFLIIDTPPGTSDEHISIVQYLNEAELDGAIVVTTPQEVSLIDVRKELNFCLKTQIRILGVIENMSGLCKSLSEMQFIGSDGSDVTETAMDLIRARAPELLKLNIQTQVFPAAENGAKTMAQDFQVPFLGQLLLDPNITGACEDGVSFLHTFPSSVASQSFRNIVNDILQQLHSR